MKLIKFILFFLCTLPCLVTCTAFKKTIVKPVVVAFPDTSFIAMLSPNCPYIKYLGHATVNQYAEAFLKGFKSEAGITKNVTLTFSETNADFILRLKSITLTETSRMETVNDPKSAYNGKQVELNGIECAAVIEITDVKNKTKKLNNCSNTKSRSEQFTNSRNLDDLINGTNKNNEYRTKLLDDNICLSLSQDVGRRVWVPITRRIGGDLE